jgi:hypothetical protein
MKELPELDVSMPDEIRRRVYEHEILLSFARDDDATLFMYWWTKRGKKDFAKWREKNSELV